MAHGQIGYAGAPLAVARGEARCLWAWTRCAQRCEKAPASVGAPLHCLGSSPTRRSPCTSQINRDVENIGARRLHTIIERLMEDLSFSATDRAGEKVLIDAALVQEKVRR